MFPARCSVDRLGTESCRRLQAAGCRRRRSTKKYQTSISLHRPTTKPGSADGADEWQMTKPPIQSEIRGPRPRDREGGSQRWPGYWSAAARLLGCWGAGVLGARKPLTGRAANHNSWRWARGARGEGQGLSPPCVPCGWSLQLGPKCEKREFLGWARRGNRRKRAAESESQRGRESK